jgi:hypothetical protein
MFAYLHHAYVKADMNFRMRFAVLRPFGTPEHSDTWDKVVHKFSVLAA